MGKLSLHDLRVSAFVFVLFIFLPASALAFQKSYEFQGSFTFADLGQYIYLDFDVPSGTTKISIAYSYGPATDEKGTLVLDIGLYDPNGFRGWSGSNKSQFSVALSREQTTDSYVPGDIPEGTWQVELGVGEILPNVTANYSVTVDLSDESVGDPFVPEPYVPVVLSTERRWYKGDLHMHSTHSDGSRTMSQVFEFAYSIGLDFVALTDHNTISHLLYIPELQDQYADMLLLLGIEFTSYRGHANVFNYPHYVDYHGTVEGFDINGLMDQVHAGGGYFSPNHPGIPLIPLPQFPYGIGWGYPETDYGKVDFYEAVNGPSVVFGFIPNPINIISIALWDHQQDLGFDFAIRGGSDDHQGGQGSGDTYAPIGTPTTVIFANELSSQGILEGLKAGHAFLITDGPNGAEVYLTASTERDTAIVGDTISGQSFDISVHILNGNGKTLNMLKNGKVLSEYQNIPIDQDDYLLTFPFSPTEPCRLRAEAYDGWILKAITNSIFFQPEPTDDDTADDDSADDDGADDDAADDDTADDDTVDDDSADDDSADDDAADDDSADDDDSVDDDTNDDAENDDDGADDDAADDDSGMPPSAEASSGQNEKGCGC